MGDAMTDRVLPWPQNAAAGVRGFLDEILFPGKPLGDPANGKPGPVQTPYSVQEISAGATNLTKVWSSLVGGAGGIAGAFAFFKGLFVGGNTAVQVAAIASGAALLSSVAIGVAVIVRGDVTARATAHAARRHAEAEIVTSALSNYSFSYPPAAPPTGWMVCKKDGTWLQVRKFNFTNDSGLVITTRSGDSLVASQIDAILSADELAGKWSSSGANGVAAAPV